MKDKDPITQFLMRADNLAIALATQRALGVLKKQGSDNLSEPVAQVLSDPENLKIARAISKRVKPIKNKLLHSFGLDLHCQLGEKLKAKNLGNHWRQGKDPQEWTKIYAGSWFRSIRDDGKDGVPYLFVIIQRTNNCVNLGISRSEDRRHRPEYWELPQVKDLAAWLLKKHGYRPQLWWLGYRNPYDLREDKLYLALAGNKDEIVKEASDATWKLFGETREMMEVANRALAKYVPSKAE